MKILKKIAAFLAFFIGIMTVITGSRVLLSMDAKEYHVIQWLVLYNVILGLVSMVVGYLIWKKYKYVQQLVIGVMASHFIVFMVIIFGQEAAMESKYAMLFRMMMWLIIGILFFIKIPNKSKASVN